MCLEWNQFLSVDHCQSSTPSNTTSMSVTFLQKYPSHHPQRDRCMCVSALPSRTYSSLSRTHVWRSICSRFILGTRACVSVSPSSSSFLHPPSMISPDWICLPTDQGRTPESKPSYVYTLNATVWPSLLRGCQELDHDVQQLLRCRLGGKRINQTLP